MTYSSCWIEVDDPANEGAEVTYLTQGPMVARLGPAPSNAPYWLPLVQAWAKSRSFEIDWVDNSWLRVRVTATGCLDFLDSVLGPGDYRTKEVRPQIDPETKYVVVAEEF